ncbi:MAG: GtrA family protein [Mucinivorans sp.]
MSRCLISRALLGRMIRFGIVGFSGFMIDFSITGAIYQWLGWSIFVATGFGFCCGAVSNYILNRHWTWRSDNPNVKSEFIKFFSVSLLGLGLHYLVLWGCLMFPFLQFSLLGFSVNNDWTGKLIATAVVMIWNFLANNFYTFRKSAS